MIADLCVDLHIILPRNPDNTSLSIRLMTAFKSGGHYFEDISITICGDESMYT